MNQLTESGVENIHEALASAAPSTPRQININVKTSGAYRGLLKQTNAKVVLISKDEREFRLDEPAYLRRLEVHGDSIDKIMSGFSVGLIAVNGEVVPLTPSVISVKGGGGKYVRFMATSICIGLVVRSTLPYRGLRILRMDFIGYTFDQLESIASSVSETIDLVQDLNSYVQERQASASEAIESKSKMDLQIKELQDSVSNLESAKSDLDAEIGAARKIVAQETQKKGVLVAESAIARQSLEATKNNQAQLEQTVGALNKEVADRRDELQRLANDRSLISDEYRDYVAEGKQQSRVYEWFLYFSIAVIALCAWQLYGGAARILEADVNGYEELLTLALQRAPFAAALALIVTVAWKLGSVFVSRIMTIHAQRLALARLLVIAKDTVYSSTAGLDLTDEQKFRERIRLKLAMLKGHLTSELGTEFDYPVRNEASTNASEVREDVQEGKAQ